MTKQERIHTRKFLEYQRRSLRNHPTLEEKLLWNCLKHNQLGCKFQRQHSIGPYIVDFYCAKKRLIIEIDGGYHNNLDYHIYDRERERYIRNLGYIIIRFWNSEITKNIEKVLKQIQYCLR